MRFPLRLRGGSKPETSRLDRILQQAIEESGSIKKSSSDSRSYKTFTLPNKIETIVISDPKTETAAASLTVKVGSYSDPVELPGLAHFLEHMLFMGTKKYPDENEYSEYLSQNGGYSNAYTASELTNYQFEVISGKLDGALDRFAQFFISPLLSESGTQRELKAVDNECSGNEQNDAWRGFLIYRELAHKYHPVHKFNIGNLETLKVIPEKKGINVRDALLKFYNKFYSSNRMKLVVLGKESLEDLEKMVINMFSSVPNKSLKEIYNHPYPEGPAFDKNNLRKLIKVVPVRDVRTIDFTFVLNPCTYENGRKEAGDYLASLIGDEGEGSILELLKKNNWANALSAYMSESNFDMATFSITIYCTDIGISKHTNDIIETVYNYINMLKLNVKDTKYSYFFEEEKVMQAISFWFKAEERALGYVTNLSAKMQSDTPTTEILVSGRIKTRDVLPMISDILDELTPDNLLLFHKCKQNLEFADAAEEYFQTKYHVDDLPADLISLCVEAKEWEKLGLAITPPNKFIANNFDIVKYEAPKPAVLHKDVSPFLKKMSSTKVVSNRMLQHSSEPNKIKVVNDTVERSLLETWEDDTFRRPIVIHSDGHSLLWLKQDTTFKKPKCMVKIFVKNLSVAESLKAEYLASLYIACAKDALQQITYPAMNAGFANSVGSTKNGLSMTFIGFAETIHKYIDLVSKHIKDFHQNKKLTAFERFKEQLIKNIKNQEKARPINLAFSAISEALQEQENSIETELNVVKSITVEDVLKFAPTMFDNVAVEILVTGNARVKDAKEVLKISKAIFTPERAISDHNFMRTSKISSSGKATQIFYIQPARNPENKGSAMCATFQFGERTDDKIALLGAFSSVLGEQFFNKLRTQQSLGYIVGARMGFTNGILSLNFYVESNNTPPFEVNRRLETFIDNMEKDFSETFSEEKFELMINAYINGLLERNKSLPGETSSWWSHISNGLYNFENGFRAATAITKKKPEDLKAILAEYLWKDAPKRAKFLSCVVADVHAKELFGKDCEHLKARTVDGVRLGYPPEFIQKYLAQDQAKFNNFVTSRGELTVIDNLEQFKANAEFYPSYKDILSKL